MFWRIQGRWQGDCTFVVQAVSRKAVLPYSRQEEGGLYSYMYSRIPDWGKTGWTSVFRQGAGRLYSRIPGRGQTGCTPVFQAGGRQVRQVVLPYSDKGQAGSPGCTPVFRQGADRLYSHIPGEGQAGCTPVFSQGAGRLYYRIQTMDRQVVLPYSGRGQACCTSVFQAGSREVVCTPVFQAGIRQVIPRSPVFQAGGMPWVLISCDLHLPR